jgi:hypothetical protein
MLQNLIAAFWALKEILIGVIGVSTLFGGLAEFFRGKPDDPMVP